MGRTNRLVGLVRQFPPPREIVGWHRDIILVVPGRLGFLPPEIVGWLQDIFLGRPRDTTGWPRETVFRPWEMIGQPWEIVGPPREMIGPPQKYDWSAARGVFDGNWAAAGYYLFRALAVAGERHVSVRLTDWLAATAPRCQSIIL